MPTSERLQRARPYLEWDYGQYGESQPLSQALHEDVGVRFSTLRLTNSLPSASAIADVVTDLIEQVAESRNWARF